MSFSEQVFAAFRSLTLNHGFLPAPQFAGLVSLLRKETDTVYSYIFARADRYGHGPVEVMLWVNFMDHPNDSLDKLPAGYRIRLPGTFETCVDSLSACVPKIEAIVPLLPAIAEAVERESEFNTTSPRWKVYQTEIRMMEEALQLAEQGFTPAVTLAAAAMPHAKRRLSHKQFLEIGKPVAERLCQESPTILESSAYAGDPDFANSAICAKLWLRAMGELSLAKRRCP
jgi:hypothetical protein